MADPVNKNEVMVLTQEGLEVLVKEILTTVNTRIGERIVGSVTESDTKHSPSAAAVYSAVNNVQHIMNLVIPSGDITTVNVTKDTKILYVVRTAADAKEAVPYVWINEEVGFVSVCKLSGIDDNPDLKAMDADTIQSAVASAANQTKPNLNA